MLRNTDVRWASTALAIATTVVAMTLWAYRPALNAGFVFDDMTSVVDNLATHWTELSWASIRGVWEDGRLRRRFVANVTFGIDHWRGGLNPVVYHRTNILAHLLVGAAMVLLTCRYLRLTGGERPQSTMLLAVGAPVSLFLLHPLNTQAVTYVVQRMTSLTTLLILLAFAAYMRARVVRGRRAWTGYVVALVLWFAALWTKQNALAFPAVVLAYEWAFFRSQWRQRLMRFRGSPGWMRLAGGLGILAAIAVAWRLLSIYAGAQPVRVWETFPGRDFSGVERVLTQARVHWLYLGLLLWPSPARLNLDHDFVVSRGLFDPPQTFLAVVGVLLLIAASLVLAARRPRLGFPLVAYFLFHSIESGPLSLELVFEHRMYLPMSMLALALGAALIRVRRARSQLALGVFFGVVALGLASATHARNLTWADPLELAGDIAQKSPGKARALHNYGLALRDAGELVAAERQLRRAAELAPGAVEPHNALGQLYLDLGRPEQALSEFRASLQLAPGQRLPAYGVGKALEQAGRTSEAFDYYLQLGTDLAVQGRPYEAMEPLRRAVELQPTNSVAHNTLGNALLMAGMNEAALDEYRAAVALNGENVEALYNLAKLLDQEGKPREAREYYLRFVEVAPPGMSTYVQQAEARARQIQGGIP